MGHPPLMVDLIKKLLVMDPEKRLTAAECLKHPYFSSLHDPEDEPEGTPVLKFDFEFEELDLTPNILRKLIYNEIVLHHSKKAVM